jgi:hypothetical protein
MTSKQTAENRTAKRSGARNAQRPRMLNGVKKTQAMIAVARCLVRQSSGTWKKRGKILRNGVGKILIAIMPTIKRGALQIQRRPERSRPLGALGKRAWVVGILANRSKICSVRKNSNALTASVLSAKDITSIILSRSLSADRMISAISNCYAGPAIWPNMRKTLLFGRASMGDCFNENRRLAMFFPWGMEKT